MQTDKEEMEIPLNNGRGLFSFDMHAVYRSWRNSLRRVGEFAFMSAILALIFVTAGAAVVNISSNGWSTEAAAWAQASGTILAVAGAAWLARGEARRARRLRREQGEESAWGVRFVLSQAQFDAQIVAAELTNSEKPFEVFDVRSWKQRSANASLALQTMLARANYVHAAVILTLCNARILVDHLSSDLEKLEEAMTAEKAIDDQIVTDIVYAHINLSKLVDQYDARLRGIRQALDRGNDMLPLDELVDWSSGRKSEEAGDQRPDTGAHHRQTN